MNPQEQRIADALVERIRQRRDTIDPELAQRIHQGLRDAPDAFYLLAQAAVAQGIQLESLQTQMQQQPPAVQPSWQGQPPPPPAQQQPSLLESIFGAGQPSPPAQNYYGQPQGYGAPTQAPVPPAQPQSQGQPPYSPAGGQPLGTSGYQAVNANLPGANASPAPQYPSGYGAPYGQPQPFPQQGYGAGPAYGTQAYPAQGYGQPAAPSGYPPQVGYGQPGYGAPQNVPAGGYMPTAPGYPPPSGYPSPGGWAQPGGSMLGGVGGVVAGVAAGALVTGAVESVIHGYENHERREEEVAREEHNDHGGSWRSDHERGLADTGGGDSASDFYKSGHDASSDDESQSKFADTASDDDRSDDGNNDDSSNDASDFGGFSGDDNS